MLEVVFYLTGEGKSPVREYLDSLDAKQAIRKKEHENQKVG